MLDNIKVTNAGTTKITIYTNGFAPSSLEAEEKPTAGIAYWSLLRGNSYYLSGTERFAYRASGYGSPNGLMILLSDHLGSNSRTVKAGTNAVQTTTLYKPWGETRYTSGMSRTNRQYTGQISEPDLGLYFYQSRFYDPYLNRWRQPDDMAAVVASVPTFIPTVIQRVNPTRNAVATGTIP